MELKMWIAIGMLFYCRSVGLVLFQEKNNGRSRTDDNRRTVKFRPLKETKTERREQAWRSRRESDCGPYAEAVHDMTFLSEKWRSILS